MARFIIRNYGPSRQIAYNGMQFCLSNDQSIETDDPDQAAVFDAEDMITVTDRGIESATSVPSKKFGKKERKVTVDDAEALHNEQFPDGDDELHQTQQSDSQDSSEFDDLSYDDLTMTELKTLAKDRGIETSGKKKGALIEALEDYDVAEVSETEEVVA